MSVVVLLDQPFPLGSAWISPDGTSVASYEGPPLSDVALVEYAGRIGCAVVVLMGDRYLSAERVQAAAAQQGVALVITHEVDPLRGVELVKARAADLVDALPGHVYRLTSGGLRETA